MPRLPTTTFQRLPKASIPRSTALIQNYATAQQQPGQTVEGESGKSPEKAQPKILNQDPPSEEEASEDVKKHNQEMSQRADRPREKVKDEDVEKDKVGKGFWTGQAGAGPK